VGKSEGQSSSQQGGECPLAVKRSKIIEPANMALANINLRNCSATRLLHHGITLGGVEVNTDFLDLSDSALLK
jgi:hypothetical protein